MYKYFFKITYRSLTVDNTVKGRYYISINRIIIEPN
jgi:hypothetical protein